MSVVIVGGHDRMHCRYKEICRNFGCKCKVFTQCPANFQNQIGSPDLIVVFTKTVAHKMLNAACIQAERTGAIIIHCNSSSACALNKILESHFAVSA